VEDTGPGINPEKIEGIFDPLTTLKPDGLGMGLSISRSIVQAHGGRIWAENKPSGGARICFTLPAVEDLL
jgi:two-component system sensor kinase FixL